DGKTYAIYVKSVCSANDESAWAGPIAVQTVAVGTDCESPKEITGLPYHDNSDTEIYDNIYSNAPGGASCGTTKDYLEGYDVVYKYTPSKDDILDIKLSGNLSGDVGVFVYTSCNDIGSDCFAGAITSNGADFGIEDLFVDKDQDYYIVISSSGAESHTEYDLDITGFDCPNWVKPEGDTTYEFYGQDLSDYSKTRIGVNPTIRQADLTWYSDANLTNKISDPSTVSLSDN